MTDQRNVTSTNTPSSTLRVKHHPPHVPRLLDYSLMSSGNELSSCKINNAHIGLDIDHVTLLQKVSANSSLQFFYSLSSGMDDSVYIGSGTDKSNIAQLLRVRGSFCTTLDVYLQQMRVLSDKYLFHPIHLVQIIIAVVDCICDPSAARFISNTISLSNFYFSKDCRKMSCIDLTENCEVAGDVSPLRWDVLAGMLTPHFDMFCADCCDGLLGDARLVFRRLASSSTCLRNAAQSAVSTLEKRCCSEFLRVSKLTQIGFNNLLVTKCDHRRSRPSVALSTIKSLIKDPSRTIRYFTGGQPIERCLTVADLSSGFIIRPTFSETRQQRASGFKRNIVCYDDSSFDVVSVGGSFYHGRMGDKIYCDASEAAVNDYLGKNQNDWDLVCTEVGVTFKISFGVEFQLSEAVCSQELDYSVKLVFIGGTVVNEKVCNYFVERIRFVANDDKHLILMQNKYSLSAPLEVPECSTDIVTRIRAARDESSEGSKAVVLLMSHALNIGVEKWIKNLQEKGKCDEKLGSVRRYRLGDVKRYKVIVLGDDGKQQREFYCAMRDCNIDGGEK